LGIPHSSPDDDAKNLDDVLTGTTLKVYRLLMSLNEPIGPRELQKRLKLSSPSVASFHLEKLEKASLATKTQNGEYVVNRVYLKHYVRLRRFLIPRFMFHALLGTFLLLGWGIIFLSRNFSSSLRNGPISFQSVLLLVSVYGVIATLILVGLLWYETASIMRKDKI